VAVITRRLSLVVLAVAVSLAWMGCQREDQPPASNPEGRPLVQRKASSRPVRSKKVDDESILVRLLLLETVQKELGLTADQTDKIGYLVKVSEVQSREFRAKLLDVFPPSQSFPKEESEARMREFRALSEDYKRTGKELRTKALAMLTPSQGERLKQIRLQVSIPAVVARPEIIKALDISEEQREKLRTLRDRMDQRLLDEWPDLRDLNPKERRQKLIEFMKGVDETKAIMDVLTLEQQMKLEELQGNKIDVTRFYDVSIPEDSEF
jgi:hypothetical protein